MKLITISLATLLLFSVCCFAGEIQFPRSDLVLVVYKDHFTIYGSGSKESGLPLQKHKTADNYVSCGTGIGACFTLTCSTSNSIETASRNSWVAVLLKASSTGVPITVYWSDSAEHGQIYGIGNCGPGGGYGNIYAVGTK